MNELADATIGAPAGGGPPSIPDLPPAIPVYRSPYAGMRCVQHPEVEATAQCMSCGGYMCSTCDFPLPTGGHICPSCAVSAQTKVSPQRKKSMYWSCGLGVVSVVGIVGLVAGILPGLMFSMFLLLPSIVGFAMGYSTLDRRRINPVMLWVATVWNGLVLGMCLLAIVYGLIKGD